MGRAGNQISNQGDLESKQTGWNPSLACHKARLVQLMERRRRETLSRGGQGLEPPERLQLNRRSFIPSTSFPYETESWEKQREVHLTSARTFFSPRSSSAWTEYLQDDK
jgi:hypothetical protein